MGLEFAVALWFTADLPNPGIPTWVKYFFKTAPGRRFLWLAPEALTDGPHSLLVNGFWGVSRHVNYLGKILQAVAIALAPGYFGVWMVWLYPLYHLALIVSRQSDDDKVCPVGCDL